MSYEKENDDPSPLETLLTNLISSRLDTIEHKIDTHSNMLHKLDKKIEEIEIRLKGVYLIRKEKIKIILSTCSVLIPLFLFLVQLLG